MVFSEITGATAAAGSTINTPVSSVPVEFSPTSTFYAPILVTDNSTLQYGTVSISSTGVVTFYVGVASNFSNGTTIGISRGSITYRI
jgi:hypothetical protein